VPHHRDDPRTVTGVIERGHESRIVAGELGPANPAMTLRNDAHALDGADVAVPFANALEDDDGRSRAS
jgi:hypothetical protein